MKRLLIAAVVGMLVSAPSANANSCVTRDSSVSMFGFLSGNILRKLDDHALGVYSAGYLDALYSANLFGMRKECLTEFSNCIGRKPVSQLAAIVKKYLNDNPERWDESGHSIVYNALLRRCLVPDAK